MIVGFQEDVKRPGIPERYALFRIEKCGLRSRGGVAMRIVAEK
jgi:hypothetical protein